jgi:tetratricopeptide (TPR) repeat protein
MLTKIHTAIIVISCICILPQFAASQTISEFVQEGMINYHEGKYENALEYFNEALGITAFIQRDVQIASIAEESDIFVDSDYGIGTSKKYYVGTSPVKHIVVQKREFTGVSPKYYVDEPFYFQEPNLAVIYNYRARTYLKMGMTDKAFDDFDKVLFLDPLLSEIYFRKAVSYQEAMGVDVCGELKMAMEMGHISAKIYYNMLCK